MLSWDHRKFQIVVRDWKVPANSYFNRKRGNKIFLLKIELNAEFAKEPAIYRMGVEVRRLSVIFSRKRS